MAHAYCVLDTQGYTHALRICNTYCSFTATISRCSFNRPLPILLYSIHIVQLFHTLCILKKGKAFPLQAQKGPGEFQEVKVPRLRDNGPAWW